MKDQSREPIQRDALAPSEYETNQESAQEYGKLTPQKAVGELERIGEGIESAQREIKARSDEILQAPEATIQEKREAGSLRAEMRTFAKEFIQSADPRKEDPAVMEALRTIAKLPFWKRATPITRAFQVFAALEIGALATVVNKGPDVFETASPSIAHVEPSPADTLASPTHEITFLGKLFDSLVNRDNFVERLDTLEPANLRQLLEDPYLRMHFGSRIMFSLAERDVEQFRECMNTFPYDELRDPVRSILQSDDGPHFLDILSDVVRDGSVHTDSLVAAMGDEVLTQNLETFGNFERAFEAVGIEPFLERLPNMDPREQYNFGLAVSAMDTTHHEAISRAVEQMDAVPPDDFIVYAHLEQGLRYGGAHPSADRIRVHLAELREQSPELAQRFEQEENTFLDRENACDRQLLSMIEERKLLLSHDSGEELSIGAREQLEILRWAMREPLMVRFGHEASSKKRSVFGHSTYRIDERNTVTSVPQDVIVQSFAALRDLQENGRPIVGKLMFGAYPRVYKMEISGVYEPVHDEACILPDAPYPYSATVHENGHYDADISDEMPGVFTSEMMPLQLEGKNLTELSEGNPRAAVSAYAGLTGKEREKKFPDTNPDWEDYAETYLSYFTDGDFFRALIKEWQQEASEYRKKGQLEEARKCDEGALLLQKKYDVMKRRFGGKEFREHGEVL